jgi:hypothetical protein
VKEPGKPQKATELFQIRSKFQLKNIQSFHFQSLNHSMITNETRITFSSTSVRGSVVMLFITSLINHIVYDLNKFLNLLEFR